MDIPTQDLTESHKFVLALLGWATSAYSMYCLYRSNPAAKIKNQEPPKT